MPCIGPLHRPRGGPKPDFDFAYLSHPPIHEVDVLLVDREDVGEVACDPGDVDQGEDNPGNLAEKKMKEIRKHGFEF